MEAHSGIVGHLWNLIAFIPFFISLLILGIIKAAVIGPVVLVVVLFGNSAVIIGLWPMHVIWTYYCIAKTRKFGIVMKGVLFLSLPVPLLLWLPLGIVGSLFTGLGYGFYWPLMATFEAVGEEVPNKFVKCFKDGTWSSVLCGCTIVRDFTDVSFHSYFSAMDAWLESKAETPTEIKPRYRHVVDEDSVSPTRRALVQPDVTTKQPPVRTPSKQMQALKAVVIWDNFFKACAYTGKELLSTGAIETGDLEAWKYSKSNIINIGIPSYTFLHCFFRSIERGCTGFLMGDNVELTSVNRPEGRVFDWLFEPMTLMKEQIKSLHLKDTEQLYLYKLALYCGDIDRVDVWDNGGVPPVDEIRKAQLHGISRRLQGFSSMLSRLPTFRRRYQEVVRALSEEANQVQSNGRSESMDRMV